MSKKREASYWLIPFAVGLVLLSALLYFIHFTIFKDTHHIFIYLLGDIAFVPIDVLLVTLIIHRLLSKREKNSLLSKLNMVIGAFFSEVGTELLGYFSAFDKEAETIRRQLVVKGDWSKRDFARVRRSFKNYAYKIEVKQERLAELKTFLVEHRPFMLGLLENPNLLEHRSFTDLLWAVFHLTEEVSHRRDINNLSDPDYEHLGGDMERAYRLLLLEWLSYMQHLSRDYPYLFSLAMRTNPFDAAASVEFK